MECLSKIYLKYSKTDNILEYDSKVQNTSSVRATWAISLIIFFAVIIERNRI